MKTLSKQIRDCRDGVVRNSFQGNDKKVVFVCSMGILRSATAARLYSTKYNTRSAGTWPDALVPLSPVLIAWADQLVFVNKENYDQVLRQLNDDDGDNVRTQVKNKSIYLNIPDNYPHMAPELIEAFRTQYEDF